MSRLRMVQIWTATMVLGVGSMPGAVAGGTQTFTGRVSDAMCGAKHSEGNIAPADCVRACVQKGANYALVVGDAIPFGRLHWFLAAGASLRLEGKVVAEAVVGRERPDPLDVLTRFRTLALMFGMPVAPKMVISTGSLIVPFEARGAGEFEGRLASSAVRFTMRRTL